MIVYQLGCGQGHSFDGWFPSAAACDEQAARGQLQCPACSTHDVRKLPSAPYVKGDRHSREAAHSGNPEAAGNPGPQMRAKVMGTLRQFILANTEDVGRKFAEVARRIHYQEEDTRNIRGVVTPQESEELREEGVETLTVPAEVLSNEEIH